ncbi:unnamed protein product, partial [Iphiclides podalirius]
MSRLLFIFCFTYICKSVTCSLDVTLLNNGPAVRGSKITFTANVIGYAGESLKYVFWDDVQPQHESEYVLSTNESKWTVEYPKELYEAGEYTAKVRLMKSFYGIWYYVASSSTIFKLTDSLNGNLVLNQNNLDRPNHFVAETISVREQISTVNITGLNWLQHGDLLNLQVKYTGSPPFEYCALYKEGQYNITGNETCNYKTRTVTNAFPLVHYFSDSDQHTVVVVVENDVGKTVSRATINIYKAVVHAQLSVIVVPVAFCLVAVILVVFGIAYYQHRSRYTIEVADFDFGQQAHLDYKTFAERLRDSFRNAFDFRQRGDNDPLTTDTRYDSMS